jgi:predicted CopG family antitoxin
MKKSKAKEPLVIQLDRVHREILERIKKESGASFGEIIRRLISKKGEEK